MTSVILRNVKQWCRQHVLVTATITFLTGCGLAPYVSLPGWLSLSSILFLALFLVLLAVGPDDYRYLFMPTTLVLLLLIGFFHTRIALAPPRSPHHIYSLVQTRTRCSLTATLSRMPQYDGTFTRLVVAVHDLRMPPQGGKPAPTLPACGKLVLHMRGRLPDTIIPGTTMMLLATIDRIRKIQVPGIFDYQLYMASKGIYCSGWISAPEAVIRVHTDSPPRFASFRWLPERFRARLASFLTTNLPEEQAGLYQALLIGSRLSVPETVQEDFKACGCMHLLAISGLHIGLLGLMTNWILNRLLRCSPFLLLNFHVPTLALLLTFPLLIMYSLIAGWGIPVVRSLLMASLMILAIVLRRQHDLLNLIAGGALVLIALNPLSLFTASFQLSFSGLTGIAILYPRITRYLLPDNNRHATHSTWKRQLLHPMAAILLISLTATVGTLPFMLAHFNRFSSIGPVMNILVEPLFCFWALPVGLLAMPLTGAAPELASLLLHAGGLGIKLAVQLTHWAASTIPGTSIWTITPSKMEISAYCILVILLTCVPARWPRRCVLLGLCLLVIFFTKGLWLPPRRAVTRVTCLDVGQGSCNLLELRSGRSILIDGGTRGSRGNRVGSRRIAPFLWYRRIWRLDDIVITHPHADHYSGIPDIIKKFQPARLIVSCLHGNEDHYNQLIETARNRGVHIVIPCSGDILIHNDGIRLICLGMRGIIPEQGRDRWSENDRGLLILLQDHDIRFLFPGDISSRAEHLLVKKNIDLRSNVLLAPHHGSASSNSLPFLKAVAPELILVSAGNAGKRYFPSPAIIRQWQRHRIPYRITRQSGTLVWQTNGQSWCCCGTIKQARRNNLE